MGEESVAAVRRSWEHPNFKMRATGVTVNDGRLLVHTIGPDIKWWALPGGGQDFQELSPSTLKREMVEELGATFRSIQPSWSTI